MELERDKGNERNRHVLIEGQIEKDLLQRRRETEGKTESLAEIEKVCYRCREERKS